MGEPTSAAGAKRRGTRLAQAVAVVIATVTAGAPSAGAIEASRALVQISDTSPFGTLEDCGNFPGGSGGVIVLDSEVEPWLDVNPTNPDNIVAIWQQDRWSDGGSRGNVAGVSLDGGESWQIVVIPGITDCSGGDFERASDPWVSFAPDGTVHQMSLVFDTERPTNPAGSFGPNGMAVSKSDDGDLTWSDPILLIEDLDSGILNDKNSLTADPNDANFVYEVWDRLQINATVAIKPENVTPGRGQFAGIQAGFRGPATFTRTTDGGQTWEPTRVIYDPGLNQQTLANQIVVLPDGTVIDFFTEIRNFQITLSLIGSRTKGSRWTAEPVRAANIISIGTLTPDDRVPVRDASILFDVAVDPVEGTLYAVWQDIRFGGIEEIAFAMSSDRGLTWSTPIKVNRTPPAATNPLRSQAFLPSVAVSENGTVVVTYYDFRNDDAVSGELADYFAVRCTGDCTMAASWVNEVRLTPSSFDYLGAPFARGLFLGDYMGLASGGVHFFAAFGQSLGGADPASIFFRGSAP